MARYPLRAIADVIDPHHPKFGEGRFMLDAVQALAAAGPPPGVVHTTHDNLMELRWVRDPRDAAAADAAAQRHATWVIGSADRYRPGP